MAGLDDLDDLEANYQASLGSVAPSVAIPDIHPEAADLHDLEANYQRTLNGSSEPRRVGSEFAKGLGNLLNLVDQISPIRPEILSGEQSTTPGGFVPGAGLPPLFGLTDYIKGKLGVAADTTKPFAPIFNSVAKDTGALVDETPSTTAGKLIGDIGREGIGGLLFGPEVAAISGITSGPGSYLGRETLPGLLGVSPETGQNLGAVAGGLTPTGLAKALGVGAKLVAPAIGATDAVIGNVARKFASDPETAIEAIKGFNASEATPFSPFVATAEASGDTGLARLQDAVRQYLPNENFSVSNAQRAAERENQIGSLFDPNVSRPTGATELEGTVRKAFDNASEAEDFAWKQFDGSDELDATDIVPAMKSSIEGFVSRIDNAPPVVQGVFSKIAGQALGDQPVTAQTAKEWLSSISKAERASGNDPVAQSLFKSIKGSVYDVLDTNAQAGLLSPDTVKSLQEARTATAAKYAIFNPSAAPEVGMASGIASKGLKDDQLASAVIGSYDKFKNVLIAAEAGGVDATPQLRQILLNSITTNAKTGLPVPQSQWAANIGKVSQQLKDVFSADEQSHLDSIIADYAANMAPESAAFATKNSATARRASDIARLEAAKGIVNPDLITRLGNMASVAVPAALAVKGNGTLGSLVEASLGGGASLIATNLAKSLLEGQSNKFDARLLDLISDPVAAEKILGSGKVLDALQDVVTPLGKATANKAAQIAAKSILGNPVNASVLASPPFIRAPDLISAIRKSSDSDMKAPQPQLPARQLDGHDIEDVLDTIKAKEVGLWTKNGKFTGQYLPLEKQISEKGATGPYQFMPATAAALGLADPNNDPLARDAAKRLILQEYQALGSLPLALASYNWGRPSLLKAIKKANSTDINDLNLPPETRNYVDLILGHLNGLNASLA